MDLLRNEFNFEIDNLKGSKSEIKSRINKTDGEKKVLENTSGDQQYKVLDPHIYLKIDQMVKEIYALLQEGGSEGKMSNSSIVSLLNEIEKDIDKYLLDFKKIEEKLSDIVQAETTRIKKDQRVKNREETKLKETQIQEEKRRLKQEEKDKGRFIRQGKPIMIRSDKPVVTRIKEVKKVLTDEQIDLKKYLDI